MFKDIGTFFLVAIILQDTVLQYFMVQTVQLTVKDLLLGSSQVLYRWNNLYIKLIGSVAAPTFHNYTGLVAGTNVGCVWVDLKNW